MSSHSGQRELVEQRWQQIRTSIKQRWPQLTDEELEMVGGDSRKLVALIKQKADEPVPEIEQEIDKIAAQSGGLLARLAQSASDAARATSEHARRPLAQAYESTQGSVAHRPAQWVTIMFLAGFATGLWLGWPQRKTKQTHWW